MAVDQTEAVIERAPLNGVLVGLALGAAGATAIAAFGVLTQSRAYLSSWTQVRMQSASNVAVAVGGLAVTLAVLVFVAWLLGKRGGPRLHRRLIGAAALAGGLVAAAWMVALSDFDSAPPAIAGGLLAALVVGMVMTSGRPSPRLAVAGWTALVVAVAVGGTALALPNVRHRVPSREFIDWWAAHRNPPIGFYAPLGEMRLALTADPRRVDEVVEACQGLADAFSAFGGPPVAPAAIRQDVATLSDDLGMVAERCKHEADTMTSEHLEELINAATASPAAVRFDAVLNP